MAVFRIIPHWDIDLKDGRVFTLKGPEYVRQKLAQRFKFWLGEWFLDRRQGVPYRRDILIRQPDLEVIRALLIGVVRSVPQVATIPKFEVLYTPSTRRLACDFVVTLITGEEVVVEPGDQLFILTLQPAA
jgi:hypothetical protein